MPEAVAAPVTAPPALRRAGVIGIGTALPPDAVSTASIAERLGLEEEWLTSRTGIRSRHIATPDARADALAAEAGASALARAGVDAADLDLVIVATLQPDEITPNTAPLVCGLLGATSAGAFDVGAACNAFLSGLAAGAAFVEAGRAERVLVIGADILSRVTDHEDRRTAALFADGAGAVVLAPTEGGGIGPTILRADASGAPFIYSHRERNVIEMEGHEVFKHALTRLAEVTNEAVDAAGLTLADIDLFVYHQANQRITLSLGQRLDLDPAKVVDCIAEQGNTSAATLPLALAHAEADGRLRPGARVFLGAFGAGYVWGGMVVEW